MSLTLDQKIAAAISNPQNLGEMSDADAIGTVGSPDCGDMLRMWVKFREQDGQKVIDRATFQTFGCETAIAVASVATELLAGKTVQEALAMDGQSLSAPLGALPPMKIHCAQLVEGALRNALSSHQKGPHHNPANDEISGSGDWKDRANAPTLIEGLSAKTGSDHPRKIVFHSPPKNSDT